MIILDNIDNINAIAAEDLTKVSVALFESLLIKREYKRGSVIDHKEDMVNATAELLKKMLLHNAGMSNSLKINIINLLDKLKTQKENLELIRTKTSASDLQQASKRLSRKAQSAFSLKQ